jgi:cation/acetate symporter
MAGKISMAGAIVMAGYLGLESAGFRGRYGGAGLRYRASSLFPAIMMGIFSKKMNKEGAMAGMLAGLFVTLFYVFAHKGIFFIKGTDYLGMIGGANSFFGITPEAFGAVGAMVNFIVAFAVDKVTKAAGAHPAHGRGCAYPPWLQGCGWCTLVATFPKWRSSAACRPPIPKNLHLTKWPSI